MTQINSYDVENFPGYDYLTLFGINKVGLEYVTQSENVTTVSYDNCKIVYTVNSDFGEINTFAKYYIDFDGFSKIVTYISTVANFRADYIMSYYDLDFFKSFNCYLAEDYYVVYKQAAKEYEDPEEVDLDCIKIRFAETLVTYAMLYATGRHSISQEFSGHINSLVCDFAKDYIDINGRVSKDRALINYFTRFYNDCVHKFVEHVFQTVFTRFMVEHDVYNFLGGHTVANYYRFTIFVAGNMKAMIRRSKFINLIMSACTVEPYDREFREYLIRTNFSHDFKYYVEVRMYNRAYPSEFPLIENGVEVIYHLTGADLSAEERREDGELNAKYDFNNSGRQSFVDSRNIIPEGFIDYCDAYNFTYNQLEFHAWINA